MAKYPQFMISVKVGNRGKLATNSIIANAVRDIESTLGDTGRVLLRPSGTEPVVRVMVEGMDAILVERLTSELAGVVVSELA
jgi:phosphoglucosamine mutase